MAQLKVNRVLFVKHHAWYLSIVYINSKPVCFWSHHDRTGMNDTVAGQAFERKHYAEVIDLTRQHLQQIQN